MRNFARLVVSCVACVFWLAGCALNKANLVDVIQRTERSMAEAGAISEWRFPEAALHPGGPDDISLRGWVRERQNKQGIPDPVLLLFGTMSWEFKVSFTGKDEVTVNPGVTGLTALVTLIGITSERTNENTHIIKLPESKVILVSELPGALYDKQIAELNTRELELLKVLILKSVKTASCEGADKGADDPVIEALCKILADRKKLIETKQSVTEWVKARIREFPSPKLAAP